MVAREVGYLVGKKEIPYWARVEDVAWPLLRDILKLLVVSVNNLL